MAMKPYYIQCGNWCIRLSIDSREFSSIDNMYIELGTRAMEHMFSAKEFDVNEYVYAIMDETGKNVLDNPLSLIHI